METLIKAGGFYHIGLIAFHLMFWRIFNWNTALESLSFVNKAVMQVLNLSLTIVFAIFAYISLAYTRELVNTSLGQALVVMIAMFWLARSIQQIVFFKLAHRASWAFLLIFLTGSLLYAIPALYSIQII